MPESAPHPTFHAMLVCDNAIREEGTGKISLIGIFTDIWTPAFPNVHPSLCVYANLSDAQGAYRMRLDLIRTSDMRAIGRGEAKLDVPDRMRPTEVVFELRGILLEEPGRYEFVLYANDRVVGSKTFQVIKLEQPPRGA